MALLKSLEIIGIRNFNPEDRQVVNFSTPVVLFQGQNGSGKTTILECIRFALTGELPAGTGTGAGFVNEPNLTYSSHVKGNVKLKFSDAQGNIITVSRIVQVQTTTRGNLQFKRLNYSVRRQDKDTNTIQDISSRCIDIDNYLCGILNVSKSIFNNVLFCHQENSLWPLDEPKKLKEKFDEIFDAIRYNKCIEYMRKTIKEKENYIKVLNERLEFRRLTKIQVERTRAKYEEISNKLDETKQSIELKKREMKPLQNRMKEILDLEETLGALQRKLSAKEEEKKGLANQQSTLINSMSYVFQGSNEELKAKIDSFENDQSSEETIIREFENEIEQITKQLENINSNIQSKQLQIGQMKEEQTQYKLKVQETQQLTDKLRAEIEVEDHDDTDMLLSNFSNALKKKHNQFTEMKSEKDIEEKQLQDKIDKIREENAQTKQSISSKNTTIKECNNKLKNIRCKLEELDTSHSQLKIVTDRIDSTQQTLKKLKDSFNECEKLQEIQKLKEQIDTKEQYLEKLDREYRVLLRNCVTEQKLDSENSAVIEKQGQINQIKRKHSQNLKTLFNDNIPEKNLRKSVLNIQNQQEVDFRNKTKLVNNLERELTTLETTLNHQKNRLKTDQQEFSNNRRKVDKICAGKNFIELLEQTYKNKEQFQKKKGYLSAAKVMYEKFASSIDETKCCPVCQTNFKQNPSVLPGIIKDLKSKIVKVPQDLIQTETELKKYETLYNELQQLRTVNDSIEMMTNTRIPQLEKEISTLTEQIEEKSMEMAAEKFNLETPQKLIEICKTLITDATLFDQYQTDIMKAKDTIQVLKESIEQVPSKRTQQETEMEIDSIKAELSNIKNRHETNKNMLDQQRERYQELNRKIQAEVQKQIDIQKLVQEKPLLEKQNTEYSEQIDILKTQIEELQLSLVSQEVDLKEAIENKNSITKTNRAILEKFQNKLMSYQNTLSDINKLRRSTLDYQKKYTSEKLAEAIQDLAKLKVNVKNLEESKNRTLSAISEKKETRAKNVSEYRALKDNITLREKQKQEEKVDSEINEFKQKIGGFNYRTVYEEKTRKSLEIEKKQGEITSLEGKLTEIQEQYDEKKDELEKPENKNVYKYYKKQMYEVTVNKLCIKDLTAYVRALERSVLKFHEERMVQINRTIRTLWRNIYRGNDIDYIEIQTDENMGAAATKRRTYHYKVVQIKNNVEFDMRGKCSAGQKVLACLVIRMALAETFSAHCGILALDEPTTNLDKDNATSLSDVLSSLIESRQNERNFQLLVITHDEEFLKTLIRVQSIDNYWQVKRSPQGNSTIEHILLPNNRGENDF